MSGTVPMSALWLLSGSESMNKDHAPFKKAFIRPATAICVHNSMP